MQNPDCAPSIRTVRLHPTHIRVVGTGHIERQADLDRRTRPRIPPFVNFRVAIREGKARRAVVIAGREIYDPRRCWTGIAIHLGDKVAIIDTVLTFVQKHERHGGSGAEYLRQLPIDD